MTCTIWGVQDLVVEDGEVESKTETNGVRRRKLGLGDIGSVLEANQPVSESDEAIASPCMPHERR